MSCVSRGITVKEFLLVAIGFILGAAMGMTGLLQLINKVLDLFKF